MATVDDVLFVFAALAVGLVVSLSGVEAVWDFNGVRKRSSSLRPDDGFCSASGVVLREWDCSLEQIRAILAAQREMGVRPFVPARMFLLVLPLVLVILVILLAVEYFIVDLMALVPRDWDFL